MNYYYIQYIYGNIYIYQHKSKEREFSEDYLEDLLELENQFIDRSLVILYHTLYKIYKDQFGEDPYVTKDGHEISNNFTIVGKKVEDKKYTLLSAYQIKSLLEELL